MNTTWIRTLVLSAAALTMGSAAYGQNRMTAEIPFSFKVNGTELPAGKYSIDRPNWSVKNVVQLGNGERNKMALGHIAYAEPGPARLVFSCREGSGCTLVQTWDRHGVGVEFSKPKATPGRTEHMAVVIVVRSEAD